MLVGRLLSYWEGNFSGAMLNFGRVNVSFPPTWERNHCTGSPDEKTKGLRLFGRSSDVGQGTAPKLVEMPTRNLQDICTVHKGHEETDQLKNSSVILVTSRTNQSFKHNKATSRTIVPALIKRACRRVELVGCNRVAIIWVCLYGLIPLR